MSLCKIFTSEYQVSTRLILDIEHRISSSLIFERHPPVPQIPRYVDATSDRPAQAVRRAPYLAPTSASQSAPCLTLMPCQRSRKTALNYLPASLVDGGCPVWRGRCWPAAVDGSAAVIGVTRVPIAGPRPSTGPLPLVGLAKPVMAQLIFQGSRQSVPL